MNLSVCGHRVLIRPEHTEDVISEGALEGFKLDVHDRRQSLLRTVLR